MSFVSSEEQQYKIKQFNQKQKTKRKSHLRGGELDTLLRLPVNINKKRSHKVMQRGLSIFYKQKTCDTVH